MDNLSPIRSFLKDLITPIVESAVKQALPAPKEKPENNMIAVQRVTEEYGISQSTIYARFKNGQLHKIKSGGLTFVDREELEKTMKVVKLCERLPKK